LHKWVCFYVSKLTEAALFFVILKQARSAPLKNLDIAEIMHSWAIATTQDRTPIAGNPLFHCI